MELKDHRRFDFFRFGNLPPGSASLNSLPTFLGMPRVLFPAAAARIALRCCWLTGGIKAPPCGMVGDVGTSAELPAGRSDLVSDPRVPHFLLPSPHLQHPAP